MAPVLRSAISTARVMPILAPVAASAATEVTASAEASAIDLSFMEFSLRYDRQVEPSLEPCLDRRFDFLNGQHVAGADRTGKSAPVATVPPPSVGAQQRSRQRNAAIDDGL